MNLEASARSLAEQFPDGERTGLEKQTRTLERFGNIAFGGFGFVLLVGIGALIYTILTRMVLSGIQPFVGILLIAFVVMAAMALAYVFLAESLKEKRAKLNPHANKSLAGSEPRSLSEGDFEPVPAASVIEDTTALLKDRSETRRIG